MRNRINVFKRRHGKVEHQVGEKTRTGSLLQRGALVDLRTSTILAFGIYKKKKMSLVRSRIKNFTEKGTVLEHRVGAKLST
jgi:hypothetical protein